MLQGDLWRQLYAAALVETDPNKLVDLCAEAREAIHDRDLQLASQRAGTTREREELEAALRQLWKRERDAFS